MEPTHASVCSAWLPCCFRNENEVRAKTWKLGFHFEPRQQARSGAQLKQEPHGGCRSEYTSRLDARRTELVRLIRQHIWIGDMRLVVAIGFAVVAWMSFRRGLV